MHWFPVEKNHKWKSGELVRFENGGVELVGDWSAWSNNGGEPVSGGCGCCANYISEYNPTHYAILITEKKMNELGQNIT